LLPLHKAFSKNQEDQAGTSKNDANPPIDDSKKSEKHEDGAEEEINIRPSTSNSSGNKRPRESSKEPGTSVKKPTRQEKMKLEVKTEKPKHYQE